MPVLGFEGLKLHMYKKLHKKENKPCLEPLPIKNSSLWCLPEETLCKYNTDYKQKAHLF
jgi:hypothetical protein